MKVDDFKIFKGSFRDTEESLFHIPQVLHSSSSNLSNHSAANDEASSRQNTEQRDDNDGGAPYKATNPNTAPLTNKVFEKDNDGQPGEEIERADLTELPSTKISNTGHMKSSLVLQILESFATDDLNDITWLKDDIDVTQELTNSENEGKEIEIYHDPPVFFQDDSLVDDHSALDSIENALDEDGKGKKKILCDISSAFVEPLEFDQSDILNSLVNVFDTAGQYEKAMTFGDIFGKSSLSKFITKWKSPPETSCDSGNSNKDTHPANGNASPSNRQLKDWRNKFVNSEFWSSSKASGENKENDDPSSPSNFNLNSIWKNWRGSYFKNDDHENSLDNTEQSLQIPLVFNSTNKDTLAHRRRVRESLRLKETRIKLAKSSTRSMENLKIRFDTLKLELHYKNSLKSETEKLNRSSPKRENPSLHEIESFFNRTKVRQYNGDVDSCFNSKMDIPDGLREYSGKLKVVNNKIKLSRGFLKTELEARDQGSLENLCRDENIPKVEVLKRMKDGTIKTRAAR